MNLTVSAEWRPARRSKTRCGACGVHFAEGYVPPRMVSGPYAGEHVCARCREEVALWLPEPLF